MILETLSKLDSKYNDLRLRKTVYNQRKRTVRYVFSYPVALSAVEKEDVIKTAKALSPQGLAVETTFEVDKFDANTVKDEILSFVSKTFPSLSMREEFVVECTNKGERAVKANFCADELTCKVIEQNSVVEILEKYFSSVTTTKVYFDMTAVKKEIDTETLLKKVEVYQSREIEIQLSKPKRFFTVTNIIQVIGKKIDSTARYISDVTAPVKNCVICGAVSYKKSYPTKNPDLYVCKMDLADKTGKFPIVFFAGKDAMKKYELVSEGDELIVSGPVAINNYSGQLELKAYNISKCDIVDEPQQAITRPEPPEYITVFPQKIAYHEQVNLLDASMRKKGFLDGKDIVVFDLETTGLKFLQDKILEIGAVKIRNGEMIETFSTLVDPETEIPKEITQINKITDEMVLGQPLFSAVVGDFYKFTRNSILVAHNLDFDYDFLKYNASFSGYDFCNERYDTMELMRKLIMGGKYNGKKPLNYKLSTIAKSLGLEIENLHRALDDSILTARALLKMFDHDPNLI
ncbi:MAG TPA: exonuclease domain-containing protein [Clostridia bacterium]|nr:exonuclease domain-containing protein [Clostridia bacterium]